MKKIIVLCSSIIVFMALSTTSSFGQGFDVLGFKQGMSKKEVESVALKSNNTIKILDYGWQVFSGSNRVLDLSFCNDSLVWASRQIDGDFITIIKVVKDYETRLGFELLPPTVEFSMGYDNKEYGEVKFQLFKVGKAYFVEVLIFGTQEHGISNGQIIERKFNDSDDMCN